MRRQYLSYKLNDRKRLTKTGGKISMHNECQAQKPYNEDVLAKAKYGLNIITKQTGYVDEDPLKLSVGDHCKDFRFNLKSNGNLWRVLNKQETFFNSSLWL